MENQENKKAVLITGASGLLGSALVVKFAAEGFRVLGHYFEKKPDEIRGCKWIRGDFSSKESIMEFLDENLCDLKDCDYLINNYGPLTYKDSIDVVSEDLIHDFFHNVIVPKEITEFFLKNMNLKVVVNVGFEFTGEMKAYRKILPYAIAKNGLLLMTLSYAEIYPGISFEMVSPASIAGGKFLLKSGRKVSAEKIAGQIFYSILKEKGEK